MELKNTQSLPEEVRKLLVPFIKEFVNLHQNNVVSAFVYGSAAGRNFIPKVSDINTAVVVKEMSMDVLQKSLKVTAGARRKRIQAPLILTEDHIRSSLDVFPIEFLEMKEHHVLVYGQDILSGLDIRGEHIRLFCEQQIKGKLIRIRQAYLEEGLKKKGIESLLKESMSSLFPVFRRMFALKNIEAPVDKVELLEKMGAIFSIDTGDMAEIWKDKRNDERIGGQDVREVFGRYISRLESLAKIVDQL